MKGQGGEQVTADGIGLAASAVAQADALLVTAGAGMGVDSGLPDFRGPEGFWQAYPPYRKLGLRFHELANPAWFESDPGLAWGFYGHRLHLYRETTPHPGFHLLRQWGEALPHGAFVFTSNVDGQFQKAGFADDRVVECHGTIHAMQALSHCGRAPFRSDGCEVRVDPDTFRASPPYPLCPGCGRLARPNVLMFGDWEWDSQRTAEQESRLKTWLSRPARLVVVECGAGAQIPTVRHFGEQVCRTLGATLVRINLRDSQVPSGVRAIALPMPARAALEAIAARLS